MVGRKRKIHPSYVPPALVQINESQSDSSDDDFPVLKCARLHRTTTSQPPDPDPVPVPEPGLENARKLSTNNQDTGEKRTAVVSADEDDPMEIDNFNGDDAGEDHSGAELSDESDGAGEDLDDASGNLDNSESNLSTMDEIEIIRNNHNHNLVQEADEEANDDDANNEDLDESIFDSEEESDTEARFFMACLS